MTNSLEKKWVINDPIPPKIDQVLFSYPQGLRQLLYNRGIYTHEDAVRYLEAEGPLYDPFLLNDMSAAIQRILDAIAGQEPIVIYGDYDVDGTAATALLVQVLKTLGAEVSGYIPDRFEEGYGLNEHAIGELVGRGARLIITVDCGIRSVREAAFAKDLGVEMIITDHHHPGAQLPPAFAIINPKKAGDPYPEKNLSGVGIAFKIAQALAAKIAASKLDLSPYLDLVAVGTVSDIVPLTGENRSLVKAGLKQLRLAKNPGLNALAGAAGLNIHKISARDIGFGLGPRLNAAGRLATAHASFDLLTAQESQKAGLLAQELDDWNRKRQNLVNELVDIARQEIAAQKQTNVILSFHPDYHQGVVGLVASRLTEEHYRPTIIGQIKEDYAVASCRSIPEFHITNALDQCADLFIKHGGHEMAAGLTIPLENIPAFKERMNTITDDELGGRNLMPSLRADIEIPLRRLPVNILDAIENIEPTGQNNPEVVFVSRNLRVLSKRTVGNDQHLSLQLKDGSKAYQAIAFRKGHFFQDLPDNIDAMYTVIRNEYNGLISTQLNIKDIKPTQ